MVRLFHRSAGLVMSLIGHCVITLWLLLLLLLLLLLKLDLKIGRILKAILTLWERMLRVLLLSWVGIRTPNGVMLSFALLWGG